MAGRLEGKVVFITGAARGQGRSHAVRFAEEGADVIGIDLCADIPNTGYGLGTEQDLHETVALVERLGRRMVAGVADVRDRESMAEVLDLGTGQLGRLDFVLVNAGIMPIFGEHSNEFRAWQDALDVMLTGAMHTVELTYPYLVEQGEGGSIVFTSSVASVQPMIRTLGGKTLGNLGYGAAKAGLLSMVQDYASALAAHQIRVNVVLPTGVNTPMIRNEMFDAHWARETADPEDGLVINNAMGVPAIEAIDVSNAMLWLCSDEGRYVTGEAIRVDAGAGLR